MRSQQVGSSRSRKLRWNIFSSMGFFIPLLLSIFFALSTSFTFFLNTSEQIENLKKTAAQSVSAKLALISGTIEYGMRNQQMNLVRTILSNISSDPNVILLALVEKNGSITASHSSLYVGKRITDPGIVPKTFHPQMVNSITQTHTLFQERQDFLSNESEQDTLIAYAPIHTSINGGKTENSSVLVLVYSMTNSKAQIRAEGYRTLATQLLVNIIITIIIAFIFHYKITRRAQSVLSKISAFIAGEDNVTFTETSADEIGLIAKGLQKLFQSIQSKTESLALKTPELSRLNRALTLENRERRIAENSAAELLEFNQTIIADSGYGILVYDATLRCVLVNPFIEKVFNVTAETIVGTPINTPPFDRLFIQELLDSIQSNQPIKGHIFYFRSYWLELSVSKITYKEKNTFLLTINDITHQKEMSDQQSRALSAAEAANRSKSNFLANMSHEIRTPMNSILGITELLKETPLSSEQSELLKRLENSGSSLLFLINDILDLSKIEAGQLNFDSVDFDLRQLAEETLGILSIPATKKGLDLTMSFDPELKIYYKGDPLRIKQILINLIGNSIKFTQSGSVRLEVKSSTGEANGDTPTGNIYFKVIDTGIGMNEATQKSLFKPFYQADASTTRVYGGTGLGLTICRELVSRMQGSIWVDSTVGSGSTFSFTLNLPLGEIGDALTNKEPVGILPRLNFSSENYDSYPHILIIDDSEENRFLVKRFLKNQPVILHDAENGEIGFQMIKTGIYSLALVDIQMPVMDGNSTIKLIREWELQENRPHQIPLIVLTANAMKEDFEYSLSLGADSYVTKPINKLNLTKEITKFLNLNPKRAQSA